jgi:glutathione S-transferase
VALFGRDVDPAPAVAAAHRLYAVVERTLAEGGPVVAGGAHPTLADVALYSYTARAPEGGVSLADYPAVRAWLQRVEALPGFVAMPATAIGLAA